MIGFRIPRSSLLLPALIALMIAGCAGLNAIDSPPRVNLVDLRPAEVTLFEQRYLVKLRLTNPNDVALQVRGMDYSIYINDRKFADGVSDRHFTVPAYGESVIEVSLTSSLFRLIEQFQKLDQRGRLVLDYRLSGRISIAGAATRYAFDHEDTLDLSPPTGGGTTL